MRSWGTEELKKMVRGLTMITITDINVGNSQIINTNGILENKGSSTGIPDLEGTS